jgi:hypothetical protein
MVEDGPRFVCRPARQGNMSEEGGCYEVWGMDDNRVGLFSSMVFLYCGALMCAPRFPTGWTA